MLFSVFVQAELLPYLKITKKSWKWDDSLLRCHLLPVFAHYEFSEITRKQIIEFQASKLESQLSSGTVYRIMVLFRHCFKLAIEWEVEGVVSNPCLKVPLPGNSPPRERYLTSKDVHSLLAVARLSPCHELEWIIQFLLLTGARKRECLDAQWSHFDFENRLWLVPLSKSGRRRYIPLGDFVIDLLNRRRASAPPSDYLFANPATGRPYGNLYRAWDEVRRQAGLADLRMHDLRHSFASFAINSGRSLYEVQRILGHANASMTQRYAHLEHMTLISAVDAVADAVFPQD